MHERYLTQCLTYDKHSYAVVVATTQIFKLILLRASFSVVAFEIVSLILPVESNFSLFASYNTLKLELLLSLFIFHHR